MKIFTADRETGTIIDQFETIENAMKAINDYEEIDMKNGDYTPDFYDIVNEDNISLIDSPEVNLVEQMYRLRKRSDQLAMDLRVVFMFMEDLKEERNPNKIKKKTRYFEGVQNKFKENFSFVMFILNRANEYANECMETYTTNDQKRISKYLDEINSHKKKFDYLNNLYHERVLQVEIQ